MAPAEATSADRGAHSGPLGTSDNGHAARSRADDVGGLTDEKRHASSHLLHPEDAFHAYSPLKPTQKTARRSSPLGRHDATSPDDTNTSNSVHPTARRRREGRRSRNPNKRAKEKWKKLLWVKQAYPDNYTDEETFLDQLKRNPRLRPYEFWSLVADSTVIVQHVASVIIFLCCFTAIFQGRLSPVAMVTSATLCTISAWILRDYWHGQLGDPSLHPPYTTNPTPDHLGISVGSAAVSPGAVGAPDPDGQVSPPPLYASRLSPRMQQRLATAKSAVLIYAALLGLSPILKSLTKSTSPDSIWAISSWLIVINIFTFDYGAGVETKVPASLSTNAALMASTVLASRLSSTTHVFSITLFSMEIFGLFPVFCRHLRHHSYRGHLLLTAVLVFGASGGLSVIITRGSWTAAVIGVMLGAILTGLVMGMTSWWLIGLQRYKNEIRGPWDPARPIIKRRWD